MNKQASTRLWPFALVASAALALAACGDKASNTTAGQKVDSAIGTTDQAAAEAKAKTEQLAVDAKAKTESAVASTKEAAKDAGAAISATVDDASITAAVSTGLAKDSDLSAIKINVDTKGGMVTLNGPAPSATAKAAPKRLPRASRA